MAKKIRVLNSPWERDFERISDCQRWVEHGLAFMTDSGQLVFRQGFLDALKRQTMELDPHGVDDGIPRRWTSVESGNSSVTPAVAVNGKLIQGRKRNGDYIEGREIVVSSGGIAVQQLLPIEDVGTGSHVTKNPDKLTRRQARRVRTLSPEEIASRN